MAGTNLYQKYGTTYDQGKVIFRDGDEGDNMYIIQEGSVRICKSIDGKEHVLAVMNRGDFFGEMALVGGTRRSADAIAASTVKLLSFNKEGFINMVENNGRVAYSIIEKLCRRLQQADMQIQHLVKGNETGMMALKLYQSFQESGFDSLLDIHKLQREFARNLEISSGRFRDFLADLAGKGLIKAGADGIELMDRNGLSDFVETTGSKIAKRS